MSDPMSKMLESLAPLLNNLSPEEQAAIRTQMDKFRVKLLQSSVVGEAGGGLVKYTTDGFCRPTKVEIDDLVFKETDKKLLSDLFCAAVNDNFTKCQENAFAVENELREELLRSLRLNEINRGGGYNYN